MPGLTAGRSRPPGWAPALRRSASARVRSPLHHPAAPPHPGHPGGELLRHRDGSVPGRGLRGGVGRVRHRAGAGGGETEGRGLRGTAQPGRHGGEPQLAVDAQHHRAGGLRPAGHRLCRQIRHPDGGFKARDGPRLRQEPRQRRAQPQGPPAPSRYRGRGAERAHCRLPAGPLRLLRRQRRRGLRHRRHARYRAGWGRRRSSPSKRCRWPSPAGRRWATTSGTGRTL